MDHAPGKPFEVFRLPDYQLKSDDRRVIPRYLSFGQPRRIRSICTRVAAISADRARNRLADLEKRFSSRHRSIGRMFREHYQEVAQHVPIGVVLSPEQEMLIGAYFTMEYSIEAAALFNPSIVPHPNQGGLEPGAVRFLMSLRATGEGHVSSVVFRSGVIDSAGKPRLDPPPRFACTARPVLDRLIDKKAYLLRLRGHGLSEAPVTAVLDHLGENFTLSQLRAALVDVRRTGQIKAGYKRLSSTMIWMAQANYDLNFPDDCHPTETVIFPATPYEARGMEDVRLVRFVEDDGAIRYFGTYTAYDGWQIYPMLLETADFKRFHAMTLSGRYARNKGMAMFPRKVNGRYMMLSRHDGERLFLLRSMDLHVWNHSQVLLSPREEWEMVQVGNCGSPIETEKGWLVLTHGVGPFREYSIGAILLDLNDPAHVIGRMREPLLVPTDEEREGYVPNVVYTCGSMLHAGNLIVPYAMSDSRTSFAVVPLDSLLHRLLTAGP